MKIFSTSTVIRIRLNSELSLLVFHDPVLTLQFVTKTLWALASDYSTCSMIMMIVGGADGRTDEISVSVMHKKLRGLEWHDCVKCAGFKLLEEPVYKYWGERVARVRDPFVHVWTVWLGALCFMSYSVVSTSTAAWNCAC
jgi:hypothetical protein